MLRTGQSAKSIDGSVIRYSQCWEDADLLVENMEVSNSDFIVCIASAGDNSLSLLSRSPGRVVAVDFCPAQLALVALKAAAFQVLNYEQLLQFLGARAQSPDRRLELYGKIVQSQYLARQYQEYFDLRPELIESGVINCGKLDNYFTIFRKAILPLVHSRRTVEALFTKRTHFERVAFFANVWNSQAYKMAFNIFFNSFTMSLLGREKQFFEEAKHSLVAFLRRNSKAALVEADPSDNCYLRYILTGRYEQLPHYLRQENYESIRANIHKLELRQGDLGQVLNELPAGCVDGFNLSDVFEYMPSSKAKALTASIQRAARGGARLIYWNMLVDRQACQYNDKLSSVVSYDADLPLYSRTFFYSRFAKDIVLEVAHV